MLLEYAGILLNFYSKLQTYGSLIINSRDNVQNSKKEEKARNCHNHADQITNFALVNSTLCYIHLQNCNFQPKSLWVLKFWKQLR